MRSDSLPIEQLRAWAQFNGVSFNNVTITNNVVSKDGVNKGAGLVATADFAGHGVAEDILLTVPPDLILSREAVHLCAKSDAQLKELLDAVGDFAESPRKAIVLFLFYQLTQSSPDISGKSIGVKSPFADYVRFLPKIFPLPTFYTDDERALLLGTSLKDALNQKLASLEHEFNELQQCTRTVGWCRKYWWDENREVATLDDWKLVDAMYRSRALDLPNIGHAMVPIVDIANHAPDKTRNARFEVRADGRILLVRDNNTSIAKDEEVNITYGAGGACEMIFSYGFLDEGVTSARELFLSLDIPLDDPLRTAKKAAAKEAPGIRIFMDTEGAIQWEGRLIWWAVVNEEDGLDFQVVQNQEGARELRTLWRNEEILPMDFKQMIAMDDKFELFCLRATVLVQERVEVQGAELMGSEEAFKQISRQVDQKLGHVLNRLRDLELELLTSAYEALEKEKARFLQSDKVLRYFESTGTSTSNNDNGDPGMHGDMEDDFS